MVYCFDIFGLATIGDYCVVAQEGGGGGVVANLCLDITYNYSCPWGDES